jgi:hypothetical protein
MGFSIDAPLEDDGNENALLVLIFFFMLAMDVKGAYDEEGLLGADQDDDREEE